MSNAFGLDKAKQITKKRILDKLPVLEQGYIEMTKPDKLNSSKQKYKKVNK